MSRLNRRLDFDKGGKHSVRLSELEKGDLGICRQLLEVAKKGVSLNLLVHRKPTMMGVSDACPYGIGGFLLTGTAWRIRIPEWSILTRAPGVNNVLEFLGMAVNVLLLCREASCTEHDCLMVLGDNTSAIGWLHRSGRMDRDSPFWKPVSMIARKTASTILDSKVCLCSQHVKGVDNVVADLLSYEGDRRTVEGKGRTGNGSFRYRHSKYHEIRILSGGKHNGN